MTKASALGLMILVAAAASLPVRAQALNEFTAAGGAWYLYKKNCSACHGLRGQGIYPVGVPLMGNAFVTGSRAEAIKAVIRNGRKGPEKTQPQYLMAPNGYMNMPPFEPVVINDRELDLLAKYLKEGFQRGEFNQAR